MNLLERISQINQEISEKKEPEKLKYKYKGKHVTSTVFTAQGRWVAKNKIFAPDGSIEKAWDTEAGDKESLKKFIKNDIEAVIDGKEPMGGKRRPMARSGSASVPSGRTSGRQSAEPEPEEIKLHQMIDTANKKTMEAMNSHGFDKKLTKSFFNATKKMSAFFKRSTRSSAIRRILNFSVDPHTIQLVPVGNRTRDYEADLSNVPYDVPEMRNSDELFKFSQAWLKRFIRELSNAGYGAWDEKVTNYSIRFFNASL